MAYRNKTYVIFDGDEDMWAYAYMLGWISKDHIAFDFHNAHDLAPLSATAGEETVKRRLRERLSNTKQAIVLIGEKTKCLSINKLLAIFQPQAKIRLKPSNTEA